jgi:hypothetical protein
MISIAAAKNVSHAISANQINLQTGNLDKASGVSSGVCWRHEELARNVRQLPALVRDSVTVPVSASIANRSNRARPSFPRGPEYVDTGRAQLQKRERPMPKPWQSHHVAEIHPFPRRKTNLAEYNVGQHEERAGDQHHCGQEARTVRLTLRRVRADDLPWVAILLAQPSMLTPTTAPTLAFQRAPQSPAVYADLRGRFPEAEKRHRLLR